MFFKKKNYVVGLDIGTSYVKMVQLKDVKEGGYELGFYDMMPLLPGTIAEGNITDKAQLTSVIRELMKKTGCKSADAVIGVSGHSSVIIKRITIPTMTEEELTNSIRYEAEQYIPFDIDDVNIDFQIIGPKQDEEGQMDVVLVAAKKNVITDYAEAAEEAGLNVILADVDSFALSNMYEFNYDTTAKRIVALINVGATNSIINILQDGLPVFTRDSAIGSGHHTDMLEEELSISKEDAERLKLGRAVDGVDPEQAQTIITNASEDIYGEISRSFDYFRSSVGFEEINGIILGGGAAVLKGFPEMMAERLGIEVELADPFKGLKIPDTLNKDFLKEMGPMAAVAVGLALRREDDK
ncbi:MAG: type IV pilus assembly protein PilM [Nitrospirae bacterium]|nr:MAG: type IV pilus assembly protein PilM [Nitrospirota bacterium]